VRTVAKVNRGKSSRCVWLHAVVQAVNLDPVSTVFLRKVKEVGVFTHPLVIAVLTDLSRRVEVM
jgi:hypothetical protein